MPAYLWIIVPKAAVLTNFCLSFETGERLYLLLVASCGSRFLRTERRESLRLSWIGWALVDGDTKLGFAGVVDLMLSNGAGTPVYGQFESMAALLA